MEVLQAISIILVQVLYYNLFFSAFLKKRSNSKLRNSFILLALLLAHIGCACIEIFVLKILLVIVSTCLLMAVIYIGEFKQYVLLSVSVYTIAIVSDTVVYFVTNALIGINKSYVWDNPMYILPIISNAVSVLVVIVICKNKQDGEMIRRLTNGDWFKFLIIPIIATLVMFPMILLELKFAVCLCLLVIVLFEIVYFYLLQIVQKRERTIYEKELADINTLNQIKHYESRELAYKEQQKKLHDFNNQMECVFDLVNQGKYENVKDYLKEIRNYFVIESNYINTNNEIVNSILRTKLADARRNGIEVVTSLTDLGGLNIKNEDLVIVISNLLDNAIEACKKLKDKQGKIIFRIEIYDKEMVISTQNNCNPEEIAQNDGYTTKADTENHGYGLINIKDVVLKYNGEDIISQAGEIYTHTIIM